MTDTPEIDRRSLIAAQARERLDTIRIALSRELATIPPPVPACDVDFNRLLDDRARVTDELQQLRRLIEHDADEAAILHFCRSSEFLKRPDPGLQGEA